MSKVFEAKLSVSHSSHFSMLIIPLIMGQNTTGLRSLLQLFCEGGTQQLSQPSSKSCFNKVTS